MDSHPLLIEINAQYQREKLLREAEMDRMAKQARSTPASQQRTPELKPQWRGAAAAV